MIYLLSWSTILKVLDRNIILLLIGREHKTSSDWPRMPMACSYGLQPPAVSLANLLHVRGEDIIQTLDDLRSILGEDRARPIHLHHPSFRDFLLNKDRCGDSKFWIDETQAHRMLATSCISKRLWKKVA